MDCVSSLPDDLISHILSFLPTKQAVLTTVLSKRWLNLWTLVSDLDIDDDFVFPHPEEGKRERDRTVESFTDFVDRVLALQGDSPIKKFSLRCETDVNSDCVDRWIRNVLQRSVSDLDIFIDFEDTYSLPQEISLSRRLVKLNLRNGCDLDCWYGAKGTFLPRLKTLVIEEGWMCWEELERFLPAFPVLEELDIGNIEWKDSDNTLSSVSLRKLTISSDSFHELLYPKSISNPKSISFDTPSLVYLNYSDLVSEDYPKVNLTNLVEARINLSLTEDQIMRARAPNDGEDDVFLRFRNVSKLVSGIKNLRKLYLSSHSLEVLSLCCESMPVFNNLKSLRIKSDDDRGWQAMPVLLRNCPHLETLVLEGLLHFVTDKCGDTCDCISREDKSRSLISCPVKKLQIKGFQGRSREVDMIKHFLESFPCLKEMEIYAEEKSPLLKDPETFQLIVKIIKLYDKLYTCDVQFIVHESLYKN